MQRRNAFELVCEPERASAACEHSMHANESVAVCDMMSCRIELQKRCTNEHTIYTHAAIHTLCEERRRRRTMHLLCSSSFHWLLERVAFWCSAS